jgi:ubiquinone biosynthesis protein
VTNVVFARDRQDRRRALDRHARRLREIAGVAVRYGLADQLRKVPVERMQRWLRGSAGHNIADLDTPVRIRLALADLGTTFIKSGQMLTARADLVGQRD